MSHMRWLAESSLKELRKTQVQMRFGIAADSHYARRHYRLITRTSPSVCMLGVFLLLSHVNRLRVPPCRSLSRQRLPRIVRDRVWLCAFIELSAVPCVSVGISFADSGRFTISNLRRILLLAQIRCSKFLSLSTTATLPLATRDLSRVALITHT